MRDRSFTICGSMWWFGVSASALRYRLVNPGLRALIAGREIKDHVERAIATIVNAHRPADARRALLPLRCHGRAQRRSRPSSRSDDAPSVLRGGPPARAVVTSGPRRDRGNDIPAGRQWLMSPTARRYWSIGAVAGIVIGALVLISGDRLGHHGIRLLGALIMAGGCLCAVVRLARGSHRHSSPHINPAAVKDGASLRVTTRC